MEIAMIIAMVLLLGVAAFLAYTIIKNNKQHSAELNKLKDDFAAALKQSTDSINAEGAAQTEFIKMKSVEEQELLTRLQLSIEQQVSEKLQKIERTALLIHTDVHDNLKNIIFDNFPSREDKIKSRVMDKLIFAVRHAARDEMYMRQLMSLLDNGAAVQTELDAANAELERLSVKDSERVILSAKPQSEKIPELEKSVTAGENDMDEQLRQLTEILGIRPSNNA